MSEKEIAAITARLIAAVRAGDPDAAAALFTEDAQIFVPHREILRGRGAISVVTTDEIVALMQGQTTRTSHAERAH